METQTIAKIVRAAAKAGAAEDLASGLDPRRHRLIPGSLWPAHRETLEIVLGRSPTEVEELVFERVWQREIELARQQTETRSVSVDGRSGSAHTRPPIIRGR